MVTSSSPSAIPEYEARTPKHLKDTKSETLDMQRDRSATQQT